MKFFYLLPLLGATLTMAAPQPVAEPARVGGNIGDVSLQPIEKEGSCVPASCSSFGCCSGNCGYWCRACGRDYSC
ncbi:hypothetical protein QBC44DRAFT_366736 [Cladorrhinum sp. PSN332]|nr:hypothetical protein QBC44DRAFT_366736 [Cladorrhinum sp. PSN332]